MFDVGILELWIKDINWENLTDFLEMLEASGSSLNFSPAFIQSCGLSSAKSLQRGLFIPSEQPHHRLACASAAAFASASALQTVVEVSVNLRTRFKHLPKKNGFT